MAKYELKERTPKYMTCILASCPSISEHEGRYIIVGKSLSQTKVNELGLAGKVGEGEAVIEVPRELIDHLKDKA